MAPNLSLIIGFDDEALSVLSSISNEIDSLGYIVNELSTIGDILREMLRELKIK